jgi:hypothetical protein
LLSIYWDRGCVRICSSNVYSIFAGRYIETFRENFNSCKQSYVLQYFFKSSGPVSTHSCVRVSWPERLPSNKPFPPLSCCVFSPVRLAHGLIKFIDTRAKCRHLKKFTCKGTLRQVFVRVYRLEIQSAVLVFSTQLCEMLLL